MLEIDNIIHIIKANKQPCYVDSYRPISLMNNIAKVIDKIISKRIQNFADKNHIIPPEQYDFREGHSTIAQIIRVFNHVKEGYR